MSKQAQLVQAESFVNSVSLIFSSMHSLFHSFLRTPLMVFALVGALSSCVPNKRLVYFQHAQEPEPGAITDTEAIKRSYTTKYAEYTLKPLDIISLRIASITPAEFDFVQKYEEKLGQFRKLNQYDLVNKGFVGIGMTGGQGGQGTASMMQNGFEIDANGTLELPSIGSITLAGLTISQSEQLIKEKLKGYFETPVVRVQLLSFHFTILGEVTKQGRYTTYDPNATIIDAIAMAENLNDFADRSSIKVVRTEGNKAEVFYVNTLREDVLKQSGFYLKPNDIIIVPPLKARYSQRYVVPNYSTALSVVSSTIALIALFVTLNNK